MLAFGPAQAGVATTETDVEAVAVPVPAPARPRSHAAIPPRARARVDHRARFSLLIVRGDGERVLRLSFPRKLPVIAVVAVAVATSALGVLVGDWWKVRTKMRESAALFQQIDEQRVVIDSFNRRVAELHKEVSGWREMHARIWEPFGPDLAPKTRATGIGGGTPTAQERPVAAASPLAELERLTETVMEEGQSLRALDRLIGRARKSIASLPSRWPVRAAVNSEFGNRLSPWTKTPEFHSGLDIAANMGTVVRAPSAATVAYTGVQGDYGLAVILDHGNDLKTIYGHLSKVLVRPGQQVSRGTELALTGNSGRSSGPHLHYEIVVKGHSVNPRAYFWD
jgi:murein DD-endopeptidase MepM/ murein hydrolase activator NlpD